MPAASMKALSPMTSATSRSQVARSRPTSSVGRSAPPASEATSPLVTLRREAENPPVTYPVPAKRALATNRS